MIHEHKEETNWVITVSLVILAVVALAVALIYTRAIMIPFVLALFIMALVSPIQDFQVRWLRLPRAISIITTLLIVLFLIALVSLGLAQVGRTIASTAGAYARSFDETGNKAVERVNKAIEQIGYLFAYFYKPVEPEVPPPAAPNEPKQMPAAAPNEPKPVEKEPEKEPEPEAFALFPVVKDSAKPAVVDVVPWATPPKEPNDSRGTEAAILDDPLDDPLDVPPDAPLTIQWQSIAKQIVRDMRNYIFNILRSTVGTIFGMMSSVFFVVIFVIFMLLGRNPHAEHSQVYTDVVQKIRRYVGIKIAVSAVTGVLVWATLRIIGLELASMFGVLAFLLNFIPSIGSMIATVLPLPIAVVQFQESPKFILLVTLVVAVPGAIQNLLGNILEPKLQGEGLDLHPVTVLLALSFWGLLWGIVGMFLAVPITAGIRIVLMQFDTFRPITDLMAGDFSRPQTAAATAAPSEGTAPVEATPAPTPSEGTEPAGSPPE